MNKYFLPIYHSQLKPWIKFWLLKRLNPSSPVTLKAVTISEGTLTKVDKSKALSIKEYYGNTVQNGTPTPESPVEVQTITGNITFNINSINYNLDLKSKQEFTGELELGSINTSGNVTTNNALRSTEYIKVEPNTQYTISNDLNYTTRIYEYNSSKTYVANSSQNTSTYTFTTSATTEYIRFRTLEGSVQNDLSVKVMLNKGSTALPYESYYNYELCKIGDYKDKIYNENGTWKVEKKVGKVILNGSEDYNYESAGQRFTTVVQGSMLQNARNEIYSNYFVYSSSGGANGYAFNFGGVIYLYNYDYTSASGLKTWLTSHNSIFYYKLQNPTTETITNTNLISQLNALYEFYVGLSTVNIYNDSEITLEVLLEYYGR